jgi:hypothetical protein
MAAGSGRPTSPSGAVGPLLQAKPGSGLTLALALSLSATACTGLVNPPAPTATPIPTIPAPPTARPPTATPVSVQWVKNHRLAEMWSGPASDRGAISFGETTSTFCSFRIERDDDDARVYVYNPYSDGRFWIDADAVGPVQPPERRQGPKPPGQNCAEAVYEASPTPGPAGTPRPDVLAPVRTTATTITPDP